MSQPSKRRALGRGLSALLPGAATGEPSSDQQSATPATTQAEPDGQRRAYFHAAIEDIYPSPEQPRKQFADEKLEELAQSIRAYGVIQPLIVRVRPEGSGYFLIAGERRWRASQRAGLHNVPVVVQDVTPKEALERALVENLQRADLNPIEEAEAYSRLIEEFQYTQEALAERVGKDRSTVANSLRLLRLPANVRRMVEDSLLSMGHARALLALESEPEIETAARTVREKGLSVRETEELMRKQRTRKAAPRTAEAEAPRKSASVRDLEERLCKALGAKVEISENKKDKGGAIGIRYIDLDDLDRLLERLLT